MEFERFVAFRYLRSRHRYRLASAIALLSGVGVAVGVMAMIVTLAVMDGFEADLKEKLLGNLAPITLKGKDLSDRDLEALRSRIAPIDGVTGLSPYVRTQVLLSAEGRTAGATLKGVDAETVSAVSRLPEQIRQGSLQVLADTREPSSELPQECFGKPPLLLGRELARHLGCLAGDLVQAVSPFGIETPFGVLPTQMTFCVAGVFQSGLYEYDASFAYGALGTVQQFLGLGEGITGIEVGVADLDRVRKIAAAVRQVVGPEVRVEDWMEQNRRLLAALRLEKIAAFAVLALILLVAVLSILSSLAMAVIEKKREIAVLKAVGASSGRIQKIFLLQGAAIGVAGTLAGVALGLVACRLLSAYPVITLPREIFYELTLPVRVQALDVLSVCLAAVGLALLATSYPSWKAARVPPAETLRCE